MQLRQLTMFGLNCPRRRCGVRRESMPRASSVSARATPPREVLHCTSLEHSQPQRWKVLPQFPRANVPRSRRTEAPKSLQCLCEYSATVLLPSRVRKGTVNCTERDRQGALRTERARIGSDQWYLLSRASPRALTVRLFSASSLVGGGLLVGSPRFVQDRFDRRRCLRVCGNTAWSFGGAGERDI